MGLLEYILLAATSLFVIMDPIALVPAFLAMTPQDSTADRVRMARWFQGVDWTRYERTELPVVDTVWENNPEPRWHRFRMPASGPHVVVYRLRE